MSTDPIADVQNSLGYVFVRRELLEQALTHRSYHHERPNERVDDNERLEFLGDAVLNFVISALLYERYPLAPEGELTRRRADLVCEPALAQLGNDIGLGAALRLGKGEERTGGREKPRLIACAVEACVGAMYLDAGSEIAFPIVRSLFAARAEREVGGNRDFKSRVQEWFQAHRGATPKYTLTNTEGPDHNRVFYVALVVDDAELAHGSGRSKSAAEQAAAEQAWITFNATDTEKQNP